MTPGELAALHGRCFRRPRPWRATEFAALLADPAVFLLTRPPGFLLGRTILDEAELLTLAVSPDHRRQGLARELIGAFAVTSRGRGATRAFLEVAADNEAARALYRGAGWRESGRRRRYYGPDLDAIVMDLTLRDPQQGS